MKLSKKALTIILSIFAVLCVYLFIGYFILTTRCIKLVFAFGHTFNLKYLILYALTTISTLIALFFDVYYIVYIAKLGNLKELCEDKIKSFKQKQANKKAERKKEARKSKIERLQNQLNELSNDNED